MAERGDLIHHLIGARQSDVCRALLLDFRYLGSKLESTDVNALLADYSSFVEKDEELRLVRDALRLSAHVLARNPAELPRQLLGRLLDRQEAGIQGLLQASENSGALAVLDSRRVVSGSGDRALRVWDVERGEVECLFTLDAPVTAVAVLPESRTIVAGDSSGRVPLGCADSA